MSSSGDAEVALLVVGGGPAGNGAATAYGEQGGEGRVLVVSDDDAEPYFRPSLSKDYLRAESGEDDLPLAPDGYPDGVEIRTGVRVTELDPAGHRATLDDGSTVSYRTCVIATGAGPATLSVPGSERVTYLRSLADARGLRERAGEARSAAVVGSGFVGCEVAVSLARLGLDVTVCSSEPVPQQQRLGDDVGGRIAEWLRAEKVTLRGGAEVTGFVEAPGGATTVQVGDGDPVTADLVLVAAGMTPSSSLAEAAGLEVADGRIVVDERMRTSADGVLAAGDVVSARNASAGRRLAVEHWDEAETMGHVAGVTAAGGDEVWDAPPGFWTDIGDHTLNHVAWGDGWDDVRVVDHGEGAFTAYYTRDGRIVGVATHDADDDLERGRELVRDGASADDVPAA